MLNLAEPATTKPNKRGRNGLTPRQEKFAQAIVAGKGPSEAYIFAGYWQGSPKVVSVKAQTILHYQLVQARIAELRARVDKKVVGSLQDRMALLWENAQMPNKNAAHRNAQARAIEVLTKIAGDGAPEMPLIPETQPGERPTVLRVVIDVFKTSPARTRASIVERPAEMPAVPQENGNGNGNGRH